ncbi:hypothetical protein VNO78_06861 [Psophocarpus tetragonolobus]|uniref:Capsid protein N-terminal domain-containing protein n=1 Tax=Psophocarpus tetragonolobus TaxID=3891 RepID=A0AAN9XRD9_PSOTE
MTRSSKRENAKEESDKIVQVHYDELERCKSDKNTLKNLIAEVNHFLDHHKIKGGKNALVADSFVVEYDLWCSIEDAGHFGVIDSSELSFVVQWQKSDVSVSCAASKMRDVHVYGPEKIASLLRVYQYGSCGQHKLTRLVKGCLLFLDHLESGPKVYKNSSVNSLEYSLDGLVETLACEDPAYIFAMDEECSTTNAILCSMCEEYSNPTFGGVQHVSISADAKNLFLVGYEMSMLKNDVMLTPEIIWGILIKYADEFSLWPHLESALVIACSLRENRYMSKVYLPHVISYCDLMYPALVKKDRVTREMARMQVLDEVSKKRLRSIRVLEAFWVLHNQKKVLKNGLMKCLKKGNENAFGFLHPSLCFESFQTLVQEVGLGGDARQLDLNLPNRDMKYKYLYCLKYSSVSIPPLSDTWLTLLIRW